MTLESELRHALANDEFVMHYQPTVDLASGRWAGVEALVRWQHPERGLLGPDRFIPIAEETRLIIPLGLRILDLVVERAAAVAKTAPAIHFAANVSVVELTDPSLAVELAAILERHELAPERLVLEITESSVMEELEFARDALEQITALGVRVTIDDFGTGYSSIGRLGELPFSGLKMDRHFTLALDTDPSVEEVMSAITGLGHALDMVVTAEGIENPSALATVSSLGCEFAQGFYFSRPVAEDALTDVLGRPPGVGPPPPAR